MTNRVLERAAAFARLGERGTAPREAGRSTVVVDLGSLFRLDDPSTRRTLVCRWRRRPDGRLACHWEPDIVAVPKR